MDGYPKTLLTINTRLFAANIVFEHFCLLYTLKRTVSFTPSLVYLPLDSVLFQYVFEIRRYKLIYLGVVWTTMLSFFRVPLICEISHVRCEVRR